MPFGIDTFRTHLDLINWDAFKIFNGGQVVNNKVTGGEPDFAGRNSLGGDLISAHGEATDALDNPRPEQLSSLNLKTSFVAPMQAPQPGRHEVTGALGYLYGKIDGDAICKRLEASINTGEFERIRPTRYYLIGVYGKAATLRWCYETASTGVSMFWQSASTGTSNARAESAMVSC
jgi:hypothetical protein